jgi:hypothetical protein
MGAEKGNGKNSHIGNAVFKTSSDKGKKAPEDQYTFCRVIFSPPCHPNSQTNEPITDNGSGNEFYDRGLTLVSET